MPTGFNVESGAFLSQKLTHVAGWLKNYLKTRRRITAKASTGKEICREYYKQKGGDIQGPDVRAMVNYLRRQANPIGSESDGYFWASKNYELDDTIQHLTARVGGITSALHGIARARHKSVGHIGLF